MAFVFTQFSIKPKLQNESALMTLSKRLFEELIWAL